MTAAAVVAAEMGGRVAVGWAAVVAMAAATAPTEEDWVEFGGQAATEAAAMAMATKGMGMAAVLMGMGKVGTEKVEVAVARAAVAAVVA